jgi:hypothetical protein
LLGLFNDLWTHEPMSTQSSVNRITSTVQTPNSYHNPDPFQQPKTQQKGWCLDEPWTSGWCATWASSDTPLASLQTALHFSATHTQHEKDDSESTTSLLTEVNYAFGSNKASRQQEKHWKCVDIAFWLRWIMLLAQKRKSQLPMLDPR